MDFRVRPDGKYQLRDFLDLLDTEFVHAAYAAILKRSPDLSGESYYLERIRNGVSRQRVLAQFMRSPEARRSGVTILGLRQSVLRDGMRNLPLIGSLLHSSLKLYRTRVGAAGKLTIVQSDNRHVSRSYFSRKLEFDEYRDSESMIRSVNGAIVNQANYWSMVSAINRIKSRLIGARYVHVFTDNSDWPDRHITWCKIAVLRKLLAVAKKNELFCFLDSDAWIRDERVFLGIAGALQDNPHKHVALSRDPKISYNSYINSGCMFIKNTPYSRKLFERVWNAVNTERYDAYRYTWPCEQHVLSDVVKAEHEHFYVLKVNALNSPCGEVVRHVWWKQMLPELLDDVSRECVFKLADPAFDASEGVEQFDINDYLDDGGLG